MFFLQAVCHIDGTCWSELPLAILGTHYGLCWETEVRNVWRGSLASARPCQQTCNEAGPAESPWNWSWLVLWSSGPIVPGSMCCEQHSLWRNFQSVQGWTAGQDVVCLPFLGCRVAAVTLLFHVVWMAIISKDVLQWSQKSLATCRQLLHPSMIAVWQFLVVVPTLAKMNSDRWPTAQRHGSLVNGNSPIYLPMLEEKIKSQEKTNQK